MGSAFVTGTDIETTEARKQQSFGNSVLLMGQASP